MKTKKVFLKKVLMFATLAIIICVALFSSLSSFAGPDANTTEGKCQVAKNCCDISGTIVGTRQGCVGGCQNTCTEGPICVAIYGRGVKQSYCAPQ